MSPIARRLAAPAAALALLAAAPPALAAACVSERPRPLRNGPDAKGADSVVGHGPVVFGGFAGATATPALIDRDGERVAPKFYFMYSKRGPERATITGWRRGRPRERLRFNDPKTRRFAYALTLRPSEFGAEQARNRPSALYLYQPNGLIAPRPGCYLVRVHWRGGVSTTVFDLTARAIASRRPS